MQEYGGFEMVTAVGAMLRAAEKRMVVLVDGFIMSACALMAWKLNPEFLPFAIFCHQGDEAGHRLMLEGMGVKGLLNLGLRLGEGTGALCAYPILQSAVRMINEMNNFQNANITKYF
jgi:nicotinate-nucleotide--dimethylbenzimidazole phosphoribosyltransferase